MWWMMLSFFVATVIIAVGVYVLITHPSFHDFPDNVRKDDKDIWE